MIMKRTETLSKMRLASELESRFLLVVPASYFVVRSSWYLAQMYYAALEYTFTAKKMATAQRSVGEIFNDVIRIREIAKSLVFNAIPFAECYDLLIDHVDQSVNDKEENDPPERTRPTSPVRGSGSLLLVHRKYSKPLRERLQKAGCSESTSARFVNDVLHLLWELESFRQNIQRLISRKKQLPRKSASLLSDISDPWLGSGHAMYHLGGREDRDNDFSNPGVLGWSLVILSEITPFTEKGNSKRLKV